MHKAEALLISLKSLQTDIALAEAKERQTWRDLGLAKGVVTCLESEHELERHYLEDMQRELKNVESEIEEFLAAKND